MDRVLPRAALGLGVLGAIGWTLLVVILMPALALVPTAWPATALTHGTLGALCVLGGLGLLLALPGVRTRLRALELPGTSGAGVRRLTPLLVVSALYGALLLAAKGVPGAAALVYAVALSVMAGASEEVWRGLALRSLGGRQRPWLAVIATALVFGALHLAAFSGPSLVHATATTLIGAAFGVAILGGVPMLVVAGVHAAYDMMILATVGVPYGHGRSILLRHRDPLLPRGPRAPSTRPTTSTHSIPRDRSPTRSQAQGLPS